MPNAPVRDKPLLHRAYKAVDLFSGAGGCSHGYWIAGFDLCGIDVVPQKRYPYPFITFDAIAYLALLARTPTDTFTENSPDNPVPPDLRFVPKFIHASPPCQLYSLINTFPSRNNRVDLLDITRDYLVEVNERYPDICWIIENVAGAPLIDPVQLCGANFGLKTYRHRFFEISPQSIRDQIVERMPPHIPHTHPQAGLGQRPLPHEFMHVIGGLADVGAARLALGIDWMTGPELTQAIPPAYTAYLGAFVRKHLDSANKNKPLFV